MSARFARISRVSPVAHAAAASAAEHAARALRAVAWYVRGVLGADAYEHYLAHHRASGCTSPPMTERQFWHDKLDRQDRHPEGRCC